MRTKALSARLKWAVALTSIFVTSLFYVFITQVCVKFLGLNKVDIIPYSTIMSSAIALGVNFRLGWFDLALLKKAKWDFWLGGTCTVFIMVSGLTSFANPELNAATVTVFLKGQLLPELLLLDLILGEKLNRKDITAFVLALCALAIPALGAYYFIADKQVSHWAVYKSPWFWVPLVFYGAAYMCRTPIIRKYSRNPAYPGNEQIRTFMISTLVMTLVPPLLAMLFVDTGVGKLAGQMMVSFYHPTWQKILASLLIAIPFGLYAPAVVWVMGNAANSSQAGILNKTFANLGNILAAVAFAAVLLVHSGTQATGSAWSFVQHLFVGKGAPAWYEWLSAVVFIGATYISWLGAEDRCAQKKLLQQKLMQQSVFLAAQPPTPESGNDSLLPTSPTQAQPA